MGAAIFRVKFRAGQTDDRNADNAMGVGMMASPYKKREL
jgi:hypothetical protein